MLINKIIQGLGGIACEIWLRVNGALGLPAQTKKEIKVFKAILDKLASDGKVRVFEWGSGLSSIFYSGYLKGKNADFEWHAIDNNKEWQEKVMSMVEKKDLKGDLTVYLKEFVPFWDKSEWGKLAFSSGAFAPKLEAENGYIDFPKSMDRKFNLVIVDARFRRRCLAVAKEILQPGGVVILHDAQKAQYQVGVNGFKRGKFIFSGKLFPFQCGQNQLWIGSMSDTDLFKVFEQI